MRLSQIILAGIAILGLLSTEHALAQKGGRKKVLSSEKTFKTRDGQSSQKLDFESTDIGGERKTPLGSLINQSKSDKNFDFIKIRLRWHPEMISSASELDAGR